MAMVDILPFITPLVDPTLTDVDFSVAVDEWNDSLSRILRCNPTAFWTELLTNEALSNFLNAFLGEFASFRGKKDDIWVMELEEVVRRVFMIYKRLSETIDSIEAATAAAQLSLPNDDAGSALLDQGLVSTSVLLDLAGIFGSSDPEAVGKIVGSILQHTPSLFENFRRSTGTVVQIIRGVQKKFEKDVSGGKGKGKGKTKAESPSISPEPEDLPQKIAEAFQYGSALLDIAHALDAVSASSPSLASELRLHDQFLQCLSGCYSYTLPVLSKLAMEATHLVEAPEATRSTAALGLLRIKMLSIVNNILDAIYKENYDPGVSLDEAAATAITDGICGVLMGVFEQSPMDENLVPMETGPMILDLEIHFNIADKLTDFTSEAFGGENDRMINLAAMLRNLREFNSATEDYIDAHNMKKSESLAKHMSSVYLQEDRDRSNSTITSDSNHVSVAPTPTAMEEDYVKRTMLISQLQDLFPDLGDGFLEACLKAFNDDPEAVTMRLLEENLPTDLASMDRSTVRPPHRVETETTSMALVKVQEETHDLLASRRNIFDGDEFDVFSGNAIDRSKVSRGKKGQASADVVLDDKSFVAQHKSAILQAVESMYDDEYDDTYDSMGINNTGADFKLVDDIDANADVRHTIGRAQMQIDPSIEHEEVLINIYTGQKEVFNRSGEARRSKKRQELRNLTKMTDEQLEGWAIMFGRNPRKAEIAQKYEFSGQQTEIEEAEPVDKRRGGRMPFVEKNTQVKQPQGNTQKPSSPAQKTPQKPPQQNKPQGQGQGQGQGQKPSGDQQQQKKPQPPKADPNARAKNERQKSSKANHNRRNQHAKKMASMNP
ncbi:hypothetical protein BG000_003795 [Podila horticola]|nr:hypothetical protein BG000_003795 [Podila horticola]